jgi:carbon storage regulator
MSSYSEQRRQVNEMLALSRKKDEALIINNNIEITVLEIKGEQVKLGISAPREVPIYRKEVYAQIQEANRNASEADGLKKLQDLLG